MKKSEAFKLGIMFNEQTELCFADQNHAGLLSNPNYPSEIRELAPDLHVAAGLSAAVAHAKQLICEKLDKEPTGPTCEFCKQVFEGEKFGFKASMYFDAVNYGPFCEHCMQVLGVILSVELSTEKEVDE